MTDVHAIINVQNFKCYSRKILLNYFQNFCVGRKPIAYLLFCKKKLKSIYGSKDKEDTF